MGGYRIHINYTYGELWEVWQEGVCFEGNTLIKTKTGYISIENLKVGDMVLSKNEETGEIGFKRISKTFKKQTDKLIELTIENEKILTTPTHPFWVSDYGWKEAGLLTTEDKLLSSAGQELVIINVEAISLK